MATSVSAEDVQRLLSYDDLIPIIENCLANFSKHEKSGVVMPVRSTVDVNQGNGYINNILAFICAYCVITNNVLNSFGTCRSASL